MTADQERAIEMADSLADLIREAHEQGGPSPLYDALGRWGDTWPWKDRRPVEREMAVAAIRALDRAAAQMRSQVDSPARRV